MPKFSELTPSDRLGSGVSRVGILLSNPLLVKKEAILSGDYQRDKDCRNANLIENAIWNVVKDTEFSYLFVPIFACAPDGSWVIMPKVTVLDTVRHLDRTIEIQENLRKNICTLTDLGIGDLHSGNLTIDGKVLDYSSWGRIKTPAEAKRMMNRSIEYKRKYSN